VYFLILTKTTQKKINEAEQSNLNLNLRKKIARKKIVSIEKRAMNAKISLFNLIDKKRQK
jgi:hypothetical protein